MRILLAPDKWKGCLSSNDAATALKSGFLTVFPDAEFTSLPLADGGEGTSALFVSMAKAQWINAPTTDALGRSLSARYAWMPDTKTAVIDSSAAAGLAALKPNERDPAQASTRGVGELIVHAIHHGAREILVGLGGSATNDAGIGLASALGWRFTDSAGNAVDPIPSRFRQIARCHPPECIPSISLTGLTDVANPLLGPRGCSRVFAPQKGADDNAVAFLEEALSHLVENVVPNGPGFAATPGAGAAGGLGFGILAFCGGKLAPGFDTLADRLDFDRLLTTADLVVTAEGSVDAQTLEGKGPAALATRAKKLGRPTVVFAGSVEEEDSLAASFAAVSAIANKPMSLETSQNHAALLLQNAAQRAARWMALGHSLPLNLGKTPK